MKKIFFLIPLYILSAPTIDKVIQKGYQSINVQDIKTHLQVLASDSLEGRETSYPGQRKAADFIANIFQKLKLEPIGDSGTYFQHFDVEVTRIDPNTKLILTTQDSSKTFTWGKDFISETGFDTIITGPLAFIGFTDSELDSSAYSNLAGHIVFVFIGKRTLANDTSRTVMMRRLYAFRRVANVPAMLMVTDYEGSATFSNVLSMYRSSDVAKGKMRMLSGNPIGFSRDLRFFVPPSIAETVLKSTGKILHLVREEAQQSQIFHPIFLENISLTIKSEIIRENRRTENVLGLLRGCDINLKSQIVAITAHYDHLGKDGNGVIYHGADDDASGTASVLELAKAFSINPVKPKRSILFMTVTGEEKGLFGSAYYTDHPIIPLENTIADLNIDMIGRVDPEHEEAHNENYTYVIGSDKISLELDSLLQFADKEIEPLTLEYKYNSENDPEQLYRRSDHYNFAKHNVPVVFFFTGLHIDYHKPTDTADKILFERMAKIVRLIYDLGWKLANIDHPLMKKNEIIQGTH